MAVTLGSSGKCGLTLSDCDDVTVTTSNPLATSNVSLGHLWINTSTGDVYSCTSATTDDNEWVNAGRGNTNINKA